MNKEQSLRTWIESYNKGEFDSKDLQTQIKLVGMIGFVKMKVL